MAVYTFEVAEDIVFPNMTVYRKFKDGVHSAYRVNANDGYVMYDTTANNTELDPDTMEEISVNYYYRMVGVPLSVNWSTFPYVAVPENEVDENYIFGLDEPDHEIM